MSKPLSVVTSADEGGWLQTAPLSYTINPWRLVWNDILLFLVHVTYLPSIVFPITPCRSGKLDELHPSSSNIFCILVHLVLSIAQLGFIVSLPLSLVWPAPFGIATFILYILGFITANKILCNWLLNGDRPILRSKVDLTRFPKHDDERWIFLNGVAVGSHWLQCNIDRIALSFGRPVLGVHNPT